MKTSNRANFSKLGVILATAGSAVGLGNVWRFPYMTGHNGGAAFILLYIGCVLILGIPGMVAEFVVGRHGASNAFRSYASLSRSKGWGAVGVLGVITAMIILGFYAVVAGWCLQYLFASFSGSVLGDPDYVADYFKTFSTHPVKPALWALAFIAVTHVVVTRGVKGGVERASNLLMPTLLVLLVGIVVASCLLPGAGKGIEFLFKPDFSAITSSTILEALGQAFFSLSLGTACLCTYASYFDRKTDLMKSATQVALIDCVVAILAGLMIFPAAAAVGVNPDSGPSLVFITLPNVFQQAFSGIPMLGNVVALMFYALLSMAALTSTISMHEIATVFFHEELHLSRRAAATIVSAICGVFAVVCALSVGAVPGLRLFGLSAMDFGDTLTSQYLLPIGSFFTCLFVGWVVPKAVVFDELTNGGTVSLRIYRLWLFAVRVVCPIAILLIFGHQLELF